MRKNFKNSKVCPIVIYFISIQREEKREDLNLLKCCTELEKKKIKMIKENQSKFSVLLNESKKKR